ncbi:MAG: hypothetical protein R3E96_11830 [Planctomycetota bacterium]
MSPIISGLGPPTPAWAFSSSGIPVHVAAGGKQVDQDLVVHGPLIAFGNLVLGQQAAQVHVLGQAFQQRDVGIGLLVELGGVGPRIRVPGEGHGLAGQLGALPLRTRSGCCPWR